MLIAHTMHPALHPGLTLPRPHPFGPAEELGGRAHGSECMLPVVIDWHPRLRRKGGQATVGA